MNAFRVAVLTIGSLRWDMGSRANWRASRLLEADAVRVRAPIRYGRISETRDNTFTMIFSEDTRDSERGRAVLLPCRNVCRGFEDLLEEAQSLWRAELQAAGGRIRSRLGGVGMLVHPARREAKALSALWSSEFTRQSDSDLPISALSKEGLLQIAWPSKEDGEAVDVDVILATANRANVSHRLRPTPSEIAAPWKAFPERAEYFFNNIRAGITTSDDEAILVELERTVV